MVYQHQVKGSGLRRVYLGLRKTYLQVVADPAFREKNPTKTTIALMRTVDGVPQSRSTVMSCVIPGGLFGCKFIYADDDIGRRISQTVVYDICGRKVVNVDSGWLTEVRCGLMVTLAIDTLLDESPKQVSFIGFGRINQTVALILRELLGIEMVVYQDPKVKSSRAIRQLRKCGVFVTRDTDLSGRDELLLSSRVLISCTDCSTRDGVLEVEELVGPELYISQDTGYILGPSFRELPSYCDYPEQLMDHFRDEFPWDGGGSWVGPLQNLSAGKSEKGPVVVYLFGMALADVYCAIHHRSLGSAMKRLYGVRKLP